MISLSGISALISYYYTLWLTPSFSVSLLIWIYQAPRLLVAYKAYKATLRVLLRRSGELDRVLATDGHSRSNHGHIRLRDTDDDDAATIQGPSDDGVAAKDDIDGTSSTAVLHGDDSPVGHEVIINWKAVRDWRVYHILRLSVVPEIRDLLRHGTAADDTLDSDHIDSPGLQYVHLAHSALLSKIVKHLHDIEGQKSALLQYAATPVDKASMEYQANLRKLWKLLKPFNKLEAITTKQWQDLGFQGKDPSTDWRSTGLFGLDALLHFAHLHAKNGTAQRVVTEAVDGGAGWYPFAIASITITAFVLQLLKEGALQLLLIASPSDVRSTVLSLASSLFLHFHSLWRYLQTSTHPFELRTVRPTVMDFERVCRVWKTEMRKWLQRGKIGGWFDSRGLQLQTLQVVSIGSSLKADIDQPALIDI